MSAIRRGQRPADRFTMISNDFHRDARLSFKARGLGGYLLSHSEGWNTSVAAIAKANGVGRDAVRTGLAELESLGYLRRVQARTDDGRLGEVDYLIQCSPEDGDEQPEPPGQDRGREIRHRTTRPRLIRPHKNTSSKNNISKRNNPSGGTADADPPTAQEADTMPTPTDHPALFDIPAGPEPSPTKGQEEKYSPSQRIVAAYVDSHRRHHGADPTRRDIGRVARDTAALLKEAAESELIRAAEAMGKTVYANLGVQLKIVRRGGKVGNVRGYVNAGPSDDPVWNEGVERTATLAESLADDPEMAAWLAGVA